MSHSTRPRIAALLLAAGNGTRFGAEMPKQFLTLAGSSVLRHAAQRLAAQVDMIQPIGETEPIAAALSGIAHLPPVPGGSTRQESVRFGLEALAAHEPNVVLVHDGCRPFFPAGTIPALLSALASSDGAIPAVPVADTLKRGGTQARIIETVSRTELYRAQTPQAFRFSLLLDLHRAARAGATDDASILEQAGRPVALVPGSEDNIKLTYPDDMDRLHRVLVPPVHPLLPRVGTGFDVHAMEEGRRLVLCGVEVPHEYGLAGHSDADVGIHALCDAIYGALAEGDIGRHFPPSEAAWKDADSARFLVHAAARIAARGGVLGNADVTLICERPKITPYAGRMIQRLAEILGVEANRVSVKATTTERLGFTGRMEGIAAQAVATVLLPG
jgi:2-C-methyl-D-erythritol 4-phosphate cytidylyltransferase / 2-C-methyl-D-erythritol 2,4-cyclodiphosphate synthase